MTLRDIVIDVFEALGEPSDLDIYSDSVGQVIDTSKIGWTKLVAKVNEACNAIANWRWPSGRIIRMRLHEARAPLKVALHDTAIITAVTPTFSVSGWGFSGSHKGDLIVSATGSGLVLWQDGLNFVAQIQEGSITTGQSVSFYTREFKWTAGSALVGIPYTAAEGKPIEIKRVIDAETSTELSQLSSYPAFSTDLGTPTGFYKLYNGLVFDVYPELAKLYIIEYSRGPAILSATTDIPELPEQFHPAIVLYCIWKGLRRSQESNEAYAVRKDLEESLARIMTEYDHQDDMQHSGQIKIYPEGR
jgi:hypothetical protein